MTSGGPRIVKGLDLQAREFLKDLARREGLSTTDLLNRLIAEEGPEEVSSQDFFQQAVTHPYLAMPRGRASEPDRIEAPSHPADEVGAVTIALDRLAGRIEQAEERSTLAITGVEQSVRGVIARLDSAEREQVAVAARFEGAVLEAQSDAQRIAERLRKVESEAAGPRSAEALRSIEGTLGKVASHVYDGEARTQNALNRLAERLEQVEAGGGSINDAVVSRITERFEEAASRTTGAIRELQTAFVALDGRMKRVEGAAPAGLAAPTDIDKRLETLAASLAKRVDDARVEMAERMRVTADGRFDRMERAISEMSAHVKTAEQRSAQAIEHMGREVVSMAENLGRQVQGVESRNAEAIEQVGGEVARIAHAVETKVNHADSVQAQALEKLGAEIARITERLAERIANAERRSAQAVDDVGEQVARVAERINDRNERTTSELADRIRQSEERTAKLLEDAREKLDARLADNARRNEEVVAAAVAPPSYGRGFDNADLSPFAEDPFAPLNAAPSAPPSAAPPSFNDLAPAWNDRPRAYPAPADAPAARLAPAAPEPAQDSPFPAVEPFEAETHFAPPAQFENTEFAPSPELEAASPFATAPAFAPPPADPIPAMAPVPAPAPVPPVGQTFSAPTFAQEDFDAADGFASKAFQDEPAMDDDSVAAPAAFLEETGSLVADTFSSAPAAPAAPAPGSGLSTREVIERARAAARGGAQPPAPIAAPSEPQPRPVDDSSISPAGSLFSRMMTGKKRTGSTLQTALLVSGLAAGFGLASVGAVTLFSQPGGATSERFARSVALTRMVGEVRTTEADTTPRRAASGGPRLAIALNPTPITAGQPAAAGVAAPAPAALSATAAANQPSAIYALAVAAIDRGDNKGVDALRRAANAGYAPAQFYLAKLYEAGRAGVPKNAAEARRWTERAAMGGDRWAMHNLALYYYEAGSSQPTAASAATAAQWFRRAADQGLVDSQYNLGRLYETGVGVSQNTAEAYKWYLIAAASGDADSRTSALRLKTQLSADARAAAERSAGAFRAAGRPAAAATPTTAVRPAAPAVASADAAMAQRALTRLGYYHGPIDGSMSAALGPALAAYQRDQNLPATGLPDAATLAKLTPFAS